MDALHLSEGAGVLDIDGEEFFHHQENADGRDKSGDDEDEQEGYDGYDYDDDDDEEREEEELEEEEEEKTEGGRDDDDRGEMLEREVDEEYIEEDDLEEEGDDESQQQLPPPTDAAGDDGTSPPRPPFQGIRYDEKVVEGELVHENEDEEGEVEELYADPSIVALAAAQQDDDIILENARVPMTPSFIETATRGAASSAIKRQVYDNLMNDFGEKRDAAASPDASVAEQPPEELEVIPEGETQSPTLPVTLLSTITPVARGFPFAGQVGSDDTNTDSADGNDGMDYFFSHLVQDGDRTREDLEEGDKYVSSVADAASPPLLSVQVSPPGASWNAVTTPLVQEHPLPTEFSSELFHNYGKTYGRSSAPSSSSAAESASESCSRSKFKSRRRRRKRRDSVQPLAFAPEATTAAAVGAFNVPAPVTPPQFPKERSIGEESLRRTSSSRPPPPPSVLLPSKLMPRPRQTANVSAPAASSMISTIQDVNEYMGGEEAEKKREEAVDKMILKTRVQLLHETTKNLRCASLVDVVFKDPENPVKPSEKELERLKDVIATELTLNGFMASSKLCDVNSAEMFRESNEKLEMLQRRQIMANPLFSEAYTETMVSINCDGRKPVSLHRKPVPIEGGGIPTTVGTEQEQQHDPFDATGDVQNELHKELLVILDTKREQHNSIRKLGDRINFLNRLIEFKTSTGVSWFRFVDLLSGFMSKATAVIFGDEEPEELRCAETASINDMDMSMSSIGVELFFGTASELLEKHLTRVCMDVGRLAIYLNIPIVLLRWPKVFISTTSYKSLLLDSITRFSSKMFMPSMFIIDNIRFGDEEEAATPPATAAAAAATVPANNTELFFEKDKKDAVRRVFENMRTGKDLAKELFVNSGDINRVYSSSGIDINERMAHTVGATIIDYKTPVFENVMNSVVNYMEKRKHLINAVMMKILRRAKLAIKMYLIQNRLKEMAEKNTKKEKLKDRGSMRNMLFRTKMSTSPPSTLSMEATPTTTTSASSTAAVTTASLMSSYAPPVSMSMRKGGGGGGGGGGAGDDYPLSSSRAEMLFPTKRPSLDIIDSRLKRLRWLSNPSSSSTSSCSP